MQQAPVRVMLEDFVPYERSLLWAVHDAYYARTGLTAWSKGVVPSYATSNPAMARQHARLLLSLIEQAEAAGTLERSAPIRVLEVGSGSGEMALNLFRAIEDFPEEARTKLALRLRYVLSDGSRATVEQAALRPELAPLVQRGSLIPALLDLRKPDEMRDLEGQPLEHGRYFLILASYVCCALPPTILRKDKDVWEERRVRVDFEPPPGVDATPRMAKAFIHFLLSSADKKDAFQALHTTYDWSPAELERVLPGEVHRRCLAAAVDGFARAVVVYPRTFFDFLGQAVQKLEKGGAALVNDCGSCDRQDLEGTSEPRPLQYGNSLAHEVNFGLVEAFAAALGLATTRTGGRFAAVHTAAITLAPPSPGLLRAFRAIYSRRPDGPELMDLMTGADAYSRTGHHQDAARLLERAHRLDPRNPSILLALGRRCDELGHGRHALHYLRKGRRLDGTRAHDFDLELGRVHARAGDFVRARRAFRRSVRQHDRAEAHAQLALVLERLGDPGQARMSFCRALRRGLEGELAAVALERVLEGIVPGADDPMKHSRQPGPGGGSPGR